MKWALLTSMVASGLAVVVLTGCDGQTSPRLGAPATVSPPAKRPRSGGERATAPAKEAPTEKEVAQAKPPKQDSEPEPTAEPQGA